MKRIRMREKKEKATVKLDECEFEDKINLILPYQLGTNTKTNVKILKFIDVSQKKKEDGTYYWKYDYKRRPQKCVVFTKDEKGNEISEEKIIYNEGITAFVYRTKKSLINTKTGLDRNDASASLNSAHNIKPQSKMSIGIPLKDEKKELLEF